MLFQFCWRRQLQQPSVTFVCWVDIEAFIELFTSPGDPLALQKVKKSENIYITIVFDFDPKNAKTFEVLEIWPPPTLIIHVDE